ARTSRKTRKQRPLWGTDSVRSFAIQTGDLKRNAKSSVNFDIQLSIELYFFHKRLGKLMRQE
ncbi:MAG: hypothetical protein NTX52_14370, partial [Planctomycetota bacterium]|nr:hypothetical protein [Planctomycetota bacterium]